MSIRIKRVHRNKIRKWIRMGLRPASIMAELEAIGVAGTDDVCINFDLDSDGYKTLWPKHEAIATNKLTACVHRGESSGEVQCKTCEGKTMLRVFECTVHGRCTVGRRVDGVACCAGCKDRQPTQA